MKKIILFNFLLLLIICLPEVKGQSIVINEIYNSSQTTDEWIEFLVLQDGLDLRGWSIRDFSSSGGAQTPLNFTNNEMWSNLKKGTIIVVLGGNALSEDLDVSDYTLAVKGSNSLFFTGTAFLIGGTSEAVEIRNASATHIHGVSWGANNANSIPEPKIHFAGTSKSNTSIYFNEDALSKISVIANWTIDGTPSRGVGNTPNNIAWINSLRARSEGSGTVAISPLVVGGDSLINLTFNYIKDSQYSISSMKIIFPNGFVWSKNLSDVNVTNFTADKTISEDTISFTNVVFTSDSTVITIVNATSPTFTGYYKFQFLTGSGSVLGTVTPLPIITVYGAPIPISEAKVNDATGLGLRNGDLVTLRGIVTVGEEFGSPSAMQDNSGGISVYGSAFSDFVKVGDEVLVTGRLTQFSGLNQIELPIVHSILSSDNKLDPIVVTPSQLSHDGQNGVENYEGLLVRLNGVSVSEINGSSVTSWAYKNYMLTGSSPSDTVQLRIDNNTALIGLVAPAGKFDIVGILSQYKSSAPFIGGYQFMPRIPADIISNGPIIDKYPEEVDLSENSISLNWGTVNAGTSRIRYGKTTNYELGIVSTDDSLRTNHLVAITGLNPATIYNLQAFSVANSDTSFSGNIISSTSSAAPTTGEINVYFNKSVNTQVSSGVNAAGNVDFKAQIIKRINNAKHSIDLAIYSLSGTVGADIAIALANAKNRGVKIRVIGEYDNHTTAPWTTLQNNGIPVISDQFGNNDGTGLMHDKFYIFDYRGGAADSIWVVTGSWNATDPGTNADRQNIIEFQDVALAGAYQIEFEEMWGSNTEVANSQNSRFGARKLNNTPHTFVIGGRHVESYFSPSDRTTAFIGKTLGKAKKSIEASILTFTRKELADSVISLHKRGGKTRIVTDNNTDTGNQFAYLQSNGVDIILKGGSGLLHHKYAVIDAESGETPYLITGSHNWSSAAENSNDENTVIIQDAQIANLFLQEFTARYYEAGGTDSIVISDVENTGNVPVEYSLNQNYPNPFNPSTTIQYSLKESGKVDLVVYNMLGQKVISLINEFQNSGSHVVKFDASHLASGIYIYRFKANNFSASKKLLLLK